jgi:hypothetical protein
LARVGQSQQVTTMKNEVRRQSSRVREIVSAWDAIPGSPPDEYDCLVDHVVSALQRGADVPTPRQANRGRVSRPLWNAR